MLSKSNADTKHKLNIRNLRNVKLHECFMALLEFWVRLIVDFKLCKWFYRMISTVYVSCLHKHTYLSRYTLPYICNLFQYVLLCTGKNYYSNDLFNACWSKEICKQHWYHIIKNSARKISVFSFSFQFQFSISSFNFHHFQWPTLLSQ